MSYDPDAFNTLSITSTTPIASSSIRSYFYTYTSFRRSHSQYKLIITAPYSRLPTGYANANFSPRPPLPPSTLLCTFHLLHRSSSLSYTHSLSSTPNSPNAPLKNVFCPFRLCHKLLIVGRVTRAAVRVARSVGRSVRGRLIRGRWRGRADASSRPVQS